MSERAICLRCDWEGTLADAPDGRCPSCGVDVFGPAAAPAPKSVPRPPVDPPGVPVPAARGTEQEPGAEPTATAPSPPPLAPLAPLAPGRRARQLQAAAVLVALALVGVVVVRLVSSAPAEPAAASRGLLVYAAPEPDGGEALFAYELETGRVFEGPEVDAVVELVRVDDPQVPSALGVTRLTESGSAQALVFPGVSRYARPFPLAQADLIAWSSDGTSVASADDGSTETACRRGARVEVTDLGVLDRETVFAPERLCARLFALGLDDDRVYLALSRSVRLTLGWTSVARVFHRVMQDRTLLSVSPTGDLLVSPVRYVSPGDPGSAPGVRSFPQPEGPTELAWRGRGGPAQIVSDGDPLTVLRVLAWRRDGGAGIVVAATGGRSGVFEFDTGVGEGPRAARLLAPLDPPVGGATYADDGTVYLSIGGQLRWIDDAGSHVLPLPPNAPAPSGPLRWMPPSD